jgi:uncharacterized membrane protein
MNLGFVLLITLGIGGVAGLRTFTAPAVVAWAANLYWINLSGSPLAIMGSVWVVGIFTAMVLVESIVDLLPTTPARTTAVHITVRIMSGLLTGACLGYAGQASAWAGAVAGAIGAVAGAFGGYRSRIGLVRALHVPDFVIAIPEDLVAIGFGLLFVSRFSG